MPTSYVVKDAINAAKPPVIRHKQGGKKSQSRTNTPTKELRTATNRPNNNKIKWKTK